MKTIFGLLGTAAVLSACVIVVDGNGHSDLESEFWTNYESSEVDGPIETTLQAFDGVKASTGSSVVVQPGEEYRIYLSEKAAASAKYKIENGLLTVGCKKKPCRNGIKGGIIVTAPSLSVLDASTGSSLVVEDGFASVESLDASASTGANLDALAISANHVTASASTGGSVHIKVQQSLDAKASTGGSVSFEGAVSDVRRKTSTGGSVSRSN